MSDPTRAMLLTYNGSGWGMTFPDGVLYTGSSAAKFDIIFDDPSGGTPDLLLRGQSGLIGTVDADNDYVFYVQVSTTTVGIDQGYNLFMGGGQIFASTGDATAPAYAFDIAHDLGVYAASGTSIGVTCSGANVATFTTTGLQLATVLAGQYGGTGVANTGKTITVSGNATIGSSTHTVALATTGNTSVTLPTTGTLATLAGTESLSGKTISLVGGSAGTPALNFGSESSDSDTGVYRIGANEMGHSAGGTNVLSVSSNGAVPTAATYPKVIVQPSTPQVLAGSGTEEVIVLDTEIADTAGAFASNAFTVPTNAAGFYDITISGLRFRNGTADGNIAVFLYVNGANTRFLFQTLIPSGGAAVVGGAALVQLSAGDVVNFKVVNFTAATDWEIDGTGGNRSIFSIARKF